MAFDLYSSFGIAPDWLRGVGIQVGKLESAQIVSPSKVQQTSEPPRVPRDSLEPFEGESNDTVLRNKYHSPSLEPRLQLSSNADAYGISDAAAATANDGEVGEWSVSVPEVVVNKSDAIPMASQEETPGGEWDFSCLPAFSELDKEVVDTLPLEIRRELCNAYVAKVSMEQQEQVQEQQASSTPCDSLPCSCSCSGSDASQGCSCTQRYSSPSLSSQILARAGAVSLDMVSSPSKSSCRHRPLATSPLADRSLGLERVSSVNEAQTSAAHALSAGLSVLSATSNSGHTGMLSGSKPGSCTDADRMQGGAIDRGDGSLASTVDFGNAAGVRNSGAALEDLPSFSQLDHSTVSELPEDIRIELHDAYQRKERISMQLPRRAIPRQSAPRPLSPPGIPRASSLDISLRRPISLNPFQPFDLPANLHDIDHEALQSLPHDIQRQIELEYERRALVEARFSGLKRSRMRIPDKSKGIKKRKGVSGGTGMGAAAGSDSAAGVGRGRQTSLWAYCNFPPAGHSTFQRQPSSRPTGSSATNPFNESRANADRRLELEVRPSRLRSPVAGRAADGELPGEPGSFHIDPARSHESVIGGARDDLSPRGGQHGHVRSPRTDPVIDDSDQQGRSFRNARDNKDEVKVQSERLSGQGMEHGVEFDSDDDMDIAFNIESGSDTVERLQKPAAEGHPRSNSIQTAGRRETMLADSTQIGHPPNAENDLECPEGFDVVCQERKGETEHYVFRELRHDDIQVHEIRNTLREWLVKVATPPLSCHVRLLRSFLYHCLLCRRLERLYTLLSYIRRYATSSPQLRSSWVQPFNQTLLYCQSLYEKQYGGCLAIQPL